MTQLQQSVVSKPWWETRLGDEGSELKIGKSRFGVATYDEAFFWVSFDGQVDADAACFRCPAYS